MEQVFKHVNKMLNKDKETAKRRLQIRTYKIIPLTPQTGVIEWVQNTIPFGAYLCDSKDTPAKLGAHTRYNPNDVSNKECRDRLAEAKDHLEDVFKSICASFQPAFRFFFYEFFSNPLEWVAARLAYTRSVACTSMVGYILGLGDRSVWYTCQPPFT